MLITAIMQFPPIPTFVDLRARLLAFDAQQSLTALMASPPPPQAFYSAHSQHSRSSHPRCSRGPLHGSQFHRFRPSSSASTRPTFSGSSQPHNRPSRSSQPSTSVLGPLPTPRPLFNVGTANNLAILLLGAHYLLVMLTSLLILLACISIKPLTPIGTWTLVPPIT
ncbi:unnamed protein product [Prunus armeniaca]|uniref:Uncharacterized protein n=1 Tax=Prunus armeniaca TaxID=36596 RepID=A0A6J5UUE8_PRUAR|nr:unnamed protein product [Prunus armeniaca]